MFDLTRHVHCSASRLVLFFMLLCFFSNPLQAQVTPEGTGGTGASGFDETPEEDSDDFQFKTVRTDSPRHTLTTFLRLRDDLEETLLAYRDHKTRVLARRTESAARASPTRLPPRSPGAFLPRTLGVAVTSLVQLACGCHRLDRAFPK